MAIDRDVQFNDKSGTRFIYGPCGNPIQIRVFKPNAKIGDPLDLINLYYDSCYNLINMLYEDKIIDSNEKFVNNLDIRVPEQPIITSTNPLSPSANKTPIVNGTCGIGAVGEIVKNGDTVEVYHSETKNLLGSGIIAGNAFAITVDLNSYNSGQTIPLTVSVYNERRFRHGGSKLSIEYNYTLL